MDKIAEMKQKKFELLKQQRAMLDKIDTEKRVFTDEEKIEYKKLTDGTDQLDKDILDGEADLERRRKLAEAEIEVRKVEKPDPEFKVSINHKLEYDPEKEFKNLGEYFYTIASNPGDKRLQELRAKGQGPKGIYTIPTSTFAKRQAEKRAQSMGTGAEGGFAMPEQFRPEIWQVQPQPAIVRPLATVIPAGDPPDAKLTMPALDQTSGSNIYGGVVITHTGEGITMTETSAALREVTMEPKEMSAYIITTNKLLNNWDAASAFIQTQLSKAMTGAEDYDFMRGDGINKSLGFINAPAAITLTRSGASTIAYIDIYTMYSRMKMGGNY